MVTGTGTDGHGAIHIHLGTDCVVVESFDTSDAGSALNLIGDTLVIDALSELNYVTGYYVTLPDGSIQDLSGNRYDSR